METYEINEDTIAVLPTREQNTCVLETDQTYEVSQTPYSVMDYSCQYFGSSYSGRKQGSQQILGSSYKVPIVVEETNHMIFFPTVSPKQDDCIWVSLNQVKEVLPSDIGAKIIFHNQRELEVPVSYRSIKNQLLRAARLESVLRKRIGK